MPFGPVGSPFSDTIGTDLPFNALVGSQFSGSVINPITVRNYLETLGNNAAPDIPTALVMLYGPTVYLALLY